MKFNIIHQPRRSGKTVYAIRKAYDNLINGKSTLVFPAFEKEFFGQMINYLNQKRIKYYVSEGTIFLQKDLDKKCVIQKFTDVTPHIHISNSKELKYLYNENKKIPEKELSLHKVKYHDIIFDDVYNNFFKKTEEIYKMLKVCCNMKNIPEVRFTYKVLFNQKQLELKPLKRLIVQNGVSYKEIQSDTKLKNYYNNNEELKK